MLNPTILLLGMLSSVVASSLTSNSPYDRAESVRIAAYSSVAYCSRACLMSWSCKSAIDLPPLFNVSFINNGVDLASCYVGYQPNQDHILLAFRGPASYENWVADWNHRGMAYPSCQGCSIVQDFYKDYTKMEKQIDSKVLSHYARHPRATILVTGHSLGGALAMIAGVRLKQKLPSRRVTVHTFGGARVGNEALSVHMKNHIDEIKRVVHDRDIVPHQPMTYDGYAHPPTEIFFNDEMTAYITCDQSGEDQKCADQYPKNEWRVEDNKFYFMNIEHPQC